MGFVGTPVIRRIAQVALGPERPEDLLARVGLPPDGERRAWAGESVDAEAYFGLLERAAGPDDHALPFRYAQALATDDLGALGLALKTAPTVGDALQRISRYILVLTDTLTYEFADRPWGRLVVLAGRPGHRRGAALANECALAAMTSMVRQITGERLAPREVSFRHAAPADDQPHREFFGCPVRFGGSLDALGLSGAQLSRRTRLGDDGLSAYLLAQLDELRTRASEPSLATEVERAVADALADGQPSKAQIARRLGMSERTLHRRLAQEGESFQSLVSRARRAAAETLLRADDHSLAEVAFLTGFSDQSAFTRAFKRWTGTTPAGFRGAAA